MQMHKAEPYAIASGVPASRGFFGLFMPRVTLD
jgi:hypothetical protein